MSEANDPVFPVPRPLPAGATADGSGSPLPGGEEAPETLAGALSELLGIATLEQEAAHASRHETDSGGQTLCGR